ncbi:MAG: redoxin domain-containing protein [Mycobacteriales bacterium]
MRRRATVWFASFAILLTACASREASGARTAPAAAGAAPAVAAQLQFTGTTLNGEPFDGASLAGKDAVLWFWTPWCPKCAREAKHVAAAHEAHGTQVRIIGVPAYGTVPEMQKFTTNFKVAALTHVADPEGKVWRKFLVTEQPAYAFIDQSGAVEIVRGEIGPEQFDAKLKHLLAT